MSEDLSPGVYVEETSFRPGSVEGVPTSTLGMAGTTEYGPCRSVERREERWRSGARHEHDRVRARLRRPHQPG